MKKIISLLIIFILIVLFTKFYDINNILDKINIPINTWKKIAENDENGIIKDDFITYNTWNIIYTDANWKIYTWIWTITIKYNNQEITILDRNLWATNNNINSEDSFWQYFQRWNNYGFTLNTWEINTEKKQININWYWPSEYSNSTFNIWENGERISMASNDEFKENLWWWWLDSQENERWLTSNNDIKLRQWPCPEGYHIPSIWERNQLIGLWIDYYTWSRDTECIFQDGFWFNKISNQCKNEKLITKFYEIFKIPQAWELISRNLYHNTSTIDLRTSSFRYKFEWTNNSLWPLLETSYANAIPLRCFANTNH